MKSLILLLSICSLIFASQNVYLIHGYGSSPLFMKSIEKYLVKNNFHVTNFGYPSLTKDLVICGESLYVNIKRKNPDTVSFVTHSMGALVLRSVINKMAADSQFPRIFRIIMVAPPNHGAEIADFFARSKILQYALGPNLEHLTTDSASLANNLPVPNGYEMGIIIGVNKKNRGFNPFIKGNNDGYLTPKSALLGTEKEDIYVSSGHSMIIHNKKVLGLIKNFLLRGTFTLP